MVGSRSPDLIGRDGEPSSGIIDSIGRGFVILSRRPYLIWMPIVLDLMLWSGVRLYVSDPLAAAVEWTATYSTPLANGLERLRELVAGVDLVSAIAWAGPTLLTFVGRDSVPVLPVEATATLPDPEGALVLLGAVIVALLIGVSYITTVGRLVRNQPAWGIRFAQDCLMNTVRLLGITGIAVVIIAFLFIPFALVGWGLNAFGIEPTGLLVIVGTMYAVWIVLYFVFSPHAISLGISNPLDAMGASYLVVRRNLLSVAGLIVAVVLIRSGTPIALQIFTESPWSIPFAIVVNAYVGTALFAATIVYFRDRMGAVGSCHPAPAQAT